MSRYSTFHPIIRSPGKTAKSSMLSRSRLVPQKFFHFHGLPIDPLMGWGRQFPRPVETAFHAPKPLVFADLIFFFPTYYTSAIFSSKKIDSVFHSLSSSQIQPVSLSPTKCHSLASDFHSSTLNFRHLPRLNQCNWTRVAHPLPAHLTGGTPSKS